MAPRRAIQQLLGLGVTALPTEVLIYYKKTYGDVAKMHTASSLNGIEIHTHKDHPSILDLSGAEIDPQELSDFRITSLEGSSYLSYKRTRGEKCEVFLAKSTNAVTWITFARLEGIKETCMLAPKRMLDGTYIMYLGDEHLRVAFSKDLHTWTISSRPVIFAMEDTMGAMPIQVATILPTQLGLLVLFFARGRDGEQTFYSVHGAFFDSSNPERLLRRSEPLWEQSDEWSGRSVEPIGIVYYEKKLISYWDFHKEGMFAISHVSLKTIIDKESARATDLSRLPANPLLTPSTHYWESKATFNPAAIVEDGKVHLLYRAIGDNDVSVMGYAVSTNGIDFDRFAAPAYVPREGFEGAPVHNPAPKSGWTSPYMSGGGGWGGCEDPRLTKVEDRLYLTYVAYDGGSPPRVALSSINIEDFLKKQWNWAPPVLISPPGIVDKNAVIFPEKINGKYVILHRIYPNILLDYVDSLDFDGETFLRGEHKIRPSRLGWDNRKVGAGAPPIKTKDGWLLIYHSVGESDPGRYKMGAMLLDLQDPTKVLYRTVHPILAPDDHHENSGWKSGVAYPCGAVVIGDDLYVYYGGADMVVCAATANLAAFIQEMKETGTAVLQPVAIHSRHKLVSHE